VNEDQLYDAAEREMDLYRAEIERITDQRNRCSDTADRLRDQLDLLQEHISTLAAGLKLSASASQPSKKSEIETSVADALLALLDPR